MIGRICDYQSRLSDDEYVFITYGIAEEYGCRINKEDVIVPVDKDFLEINRENRYPCMINTNHIIRVTISKEMKWRTLQ